MTDRKLSDAEAGALWREAERRLRLVDTEPPLAMSKVDGLLDLLGRRRADESLTAWLARGRTPVAETDRPSAEIIQFNPRRQRFVPVAEVVRLAADTADVALPLPSGELETTDGRFRLEVAAEDGHVVIGVHALGLAADEFAERTMGLAGEGAAVPVAVLSLDADGDGEVRLPDSEDLRRALLRPALGLIEDL
jgi:hypothetical protein